MGIAVELRLDVFNRAVEVGTGSVHLVDEGDARNVVLVHLAPNRFRLGLYACNCAEYCDRAVENTQRTFYFCSKVDVSGGVDKVDLVLNALVGTVLCRPVARNSRRCDGDTAFAFLFHPVCNGSTFVNFADFVNYAAVEQNTFGASCLACVDVRRYTDVSGIFQRLCSIGRIFF